MNKIYPRYSAESYSSGILINKGLKSVKLEFRSSIQSTEFLELEITLIIPPLPLHETELNVESWILIEVLWT